MARVRKEPFLLKCHTCGEETPWTITHCLVDYHGIEHAYECTRCGCVVPDFALQRYLETGKICIPV